MDLSGAFLTVNTQGSSVLSMIVLNHDETRKALRSLLLSTT